MNYESHLFICTRCVTQAGENEVGLELQQKVKKYFREYHPDKKIRINKSGCLGKCKNGVNAVHYPSGVWLEKLNRQSEQEIIDCINTHTPKDA